MQFSVQSEDFLKKLNMASGAIGSVNVLPILEDFLFDLKGNELTITASDLETSICLLYTSPSPRDRQKSRMPSSA